MDNFLTTGVKTCHSRWRRQRECDCLPSVRVEDGVAAATALPGRVAIDQRWVLFAALVVLNVADVITTALVLASGGVESNPFVQPIVHDMASVSLLKAAVLGIVGCLLVRCRDSRIAELALTLTTGWYLAVVGWNVAVLALI